MTKKIKTHCPHCNKHATHSLKKIMYKNKERKIDFSQFDIKPLDKGRVEKIVRKAVQNNHIVTLKCHICNKKHEIECHISIK